MKRRILSIVLVLAMLLAAMPIGATAAGAASSYDLLVDYVRANGIEDDRGYITIEVSHNDENDYEYIFRVTDLGDSLYFGLFIYGMTDPCVDSFTEFLLKKDSNDLNTYFAMLLFYDGDYIDGLEEYLTLNRSTYSSGQAQTITVSSTYITTDDASQYFTGSLTLLCEFWNAFMLENLDFGLAELGFTSFQSALPESFTVNGTVTSAGDGDATVTLTDTSGQQATTIVSGTSGEYSFTYVPAGTYTLSISKENHVTREYTVVVEGDVTQDATITLIGDTNGDGKLNMKDWSRLYDHVSKTAPLTDYALACADVNQDGKVNMKDWSRLYDHITKVDPLW